jgi:RNA polymerase sigma-70 factor (ECF subfamily)
MNQREIFEKAYIELSDQIFRYIYFRIFDRDKAKDLTQETFCKVWDYIAKGNYIENLNAFLYRTAHNISVNAIRDKKPEVSLEHLTETFGFDLADISQIEAKQQSQDIASIIDSFKILHEQDQELLKLRYIDGLSIKEIADIQQKSENTISVKIHRLVEKLKEYHG